MKLLRAGTNRWVTLCYLSLEAFYRWDIILSVWKSLMSVWPTGSRRNSDLCFLLPRHWFSNRGCESILICSVLAQSFIFWLQVLETNQILLKKVGDLLALPQSWQALGSESHVFFISWPCCLLYGVGSSQAVLPNAGKWHFKVNRLQTCGSKWKEYLWDSK